MSLLTTCDNKQADNALISVLTDGLLSFSCGLITKSSKKNFNYYLKYLFMLNKINM